MKRFVKLYFFAAVICFYCWSMTTIAPITDLYFSGRWEINLGKSVGGEYAAKALNLLQTADSLSIERITTEDKSFVERISFDKEPCISITTSGRRKTGRASWNEKGKSFTENAVLGEPGDSGKVAFTAEEKWSLSDDGKELIIQNTVVNESTGGTMKVKAVYDKR